MALAKFGGLGFIIGDIDFKFLPSGKAVANFPVSYKKRKKVGDEWIDDKSYVVQYAAWGELAEYINNNFQAKTEIDVDGEFEGVRTYTKNDGSDGFAIEATVRRVGAPIPKRDSGGGSWGKNPASNHDVL